MSRFDAAGPITHYLCIGCPLGCRLEVEEDAEGSIVEVRGFSCRKGKVFAEREHTDPRRMVTATVAVNGGLWARLPVHTTDEIPKNRLWDVVRALGGIVVVAPIHLGDIVLQDACGTGVDVVASRDMPAVERPTPAWSLSPRS
jgi:CxxC motif-containing protein